jgi:hypothetical protein
MAKRKARTAAEVCVLKAEMPLAELRQARERSQEELARELKVGTASGRKARKICCRNTRISASNAARGRSRSTTSCRGSSDSASLANCIEFTIGTPRPFRREAGGARRHSRRSIRYGAGFEIAEAIDALIAANYPRSEVWDWAASLS